MPGDVAQRVQDRIGAARAELQAQVAVAQARIEVVVWEGPHGRELGWSPAFQAITLVEQRGTDPDRDGQTVRNDAWPEDAGIGRRPGDTDGRWRAAGREETRAFGSGPQQIRQFAAVGRGQVE